MEGMCIYLLDRRRNSNGLSTWFMTLNVNCYMWVAQLMFAIDGAPQKVHVWAGTKAILVSTNILWRDAQNILTKEMSNTSPGL